MAQPLRKERFGPYNLAVRAKLVMRMNVNRDTGCWEWVADLVGGYGHLKTKLASGKWRSEKAHRLSYEEFIGPIGDLYVLHRCDNPKCINPAHLFLGTIRENNVDRMLKGRSRPRRGEEHGRAKLTADDVADLRRRHAEKPLCWSEEGRRLGVSHQTIRDAVLGLHWKSVA